MKPLSVTELNSYCLFLNDLFEGAQLQKVETEVELICFEFYRRGLIKLYVSLKQIHPLIFFGHEKEGIKLNKKTTPVQVFCQANLRNLKFVSTHVVQAEGRVVVLTLTDGTSTSEIKLVLVPRSVNLVVSANSKSISWNKPRVLPASQIVEWASEVKEIDWIAWNREVISFVKGISQNSKNLQTNVPNFEKQIEKKQKALASIKADFESNQNSLLELEAKGKTLKENPSAGLQQSKNQNYGEQLNEVFDSIKKTKAKINSQSERIKIIETEIEALKLKSEQPATKEQLQKPMQSNLLTKAEAEGRQKLIQGKHLVVMGKSAADNLRILRKASSWDLWIHVKDQPSAYAILSRNRNESISDEVLREACTWFIEETFKKKSQKMERAKYEFLVGECRNVSPIKGDKLGRVTHRSMRTFSVSLK